jgi:hypothetical protein
MATEYISPNMDLVIPVPTQDPGPNWSYALNASLTILDAHNHVSGSGVQIPTAGLNINANLNFNTFAAMDLYASTFSPRSGTLSPVSPYISCAYAVGSNGELYWNDSNGHSVQITLNGSVNVSGGIGFTGLPSGTAAANYLSASGTFQFLQSVGTGANLDVASIAIRYPGSYPNPSGDYIQLEAPSSLASAYSLILPALPAQTNVMTLGNTGIISSTTWDAVGENMSYIGANAIASSMTSAGADAIAATMDSTGANAIIAKVTSVGSGPANTIIAAVTSVPTGVANLMGTSMNSTGANAVIGSVTSVSSGPANTIIAAVTSVPTGVANLMGTSMNSTGANAVAASRTRSTGGTVGTGGVAVAPSCGNFSTSSSTPVSVTSQSVIITTSGRPVIVGVSPIAQSISNAAGMLYSGTQSGYILIYNQTLNEPFPMQLGAPSVGPNGVTQSFTILDNVPAGTYTYFFQAFTLTGSGTVFINNIYMYAYEL